MIYAIFDSTGFIEKVVNSPLQEFADLQCVGDQIALNIGQDYINSNEWYIANPLTTPILTEKPDNPTTANKTSIIADGIDSLILSNIPVGSNAKIQRNGDSLSETDIVNDGQIEYTFALSPGQYSVEVSLFPYKTYFLTVNVTES